MKRIAKIKFFQRKFFQWRDFKYYSNFSRNEIFGVPLNGETYSTVNYSEHAVLNAELV